jgi:protein O-mannosyl-transferase
MNKNQQFWLFGTLGLTFLVFVNGFKNDFTAWDDIDYLLNNPLLQNLSLNGLVNIFSTFANANYHPLTTLTNAIETQLFGTKQNVFFAGNLFLHLLNTYLVFRFISLISKQFSVSVITALFFGIHPMHVESVTWLSERKDVLYTFFMLASLIFYIKHKQTNHIKNLIYCFLLFFASLLSKSAAVILPLVLLLIDTYLYPTLPYFSQNFKFKNIAEKIPFFVVSFTFGIIAIKAQASGKAIDSLTFSYLDRFFLISYSLVFYLFKAILPFKLSALHPYPEQLGFWHYLSPFILLLFAFLIFRLKILQKEVIFGVLFFIINLLLVLQFIPIGQAMVAERYTYVPYIGLFFILGHLYHLFTTQKSDYQYYILGLIGILTLYFSIMSWNRNAIWKNQDTLFADVVLKYPRASTGYINLGNDKQDKGDFRGAIQEYDKALTINSNLGLALYNRGTAKYALSDWKGAMQDYQKALGINPKNYDIWSNLAGTKFQLKDYQGAIASYSEVIRLRSDFKDAYRNRGMCYLQLGQMDKACTDWQKAKNLGINDLEKFLDKYCKN